MSKNTNKTNTQKKPFYLGWHTYFFFIFFLFFLGVLSKVAVSAFLPVL